MNNRKWFVAGAMAVLLTGVAAAADKAEQTQAAATTNAVAVKAQTLCPVMKGPIDKSQFVDYDGKRIYVCCGGCIAKIKKDPAKFVKQLEAEGITLDKAETPKAK
jgi:hypothetical protein